MNENESSVQTDVFPAEADVLPAPETPSDAPDVSPETEFAVPAKNALLPKLLRRGIPLLLSGVTAAVMGFCALNAVLAAGITEERVTQLFLSDFAVGAAYVRPMRLAEAPSPLSPIPMPPEETPLPEESAPELLLAPDPEEETEPEEASEMPEPPSQSSEQPESPEPRELILSNETGYSPDLSAILARPRAIEPLETLLAEYGDDAPTALILHTHATEAYEDSPDCRNADNSRNVVSLGALLADLLNEAGIPAIHDETPFDLPDYTMAYYSASRAIRTAIADHPSIRYILDLHRDSVKDADGNEIPFVCETEEGSVARLMFVVGTDFGGADHPGWQDNLALAARLQLALSNQGNGSLMRNLNLRSASFNEQYTPGSLLIEVGSGGNTIEEAERSVALFAEAFIREVKGD